MDKIRQPTCAHVTLSLGLTASLEPCKVELLEAINLTGSISAAARMMGVSYTYAWYLMDEMNRSFRSPFINTERGGSNGGRAVLTDCGRRVISSYRLIQTKVDAVVKKEMALLVKEAKPRVRILSK